MYRMTTSFNRLACKVSRKSGAIHHLDHITDAVIRDNQGRVVLHTADAMGGDLKPYLLPAPLKGLKHM